MPVQFASAVSTAQPSLIKAVRSGLTRCFQSIQAISLQREQAVHVHGCQVWATTSPYSGQDIQSMPALVQDELESQLPMQKAMHGGDAFTYGSLNLHVDGDLGGPWPPMRVYGNALTGFGGIVDRLLVPSNRSEGPLVATEGVHVSLVYSIYNTRSDAMSDVQKDAVMLMLPSARQRLNKSVGRWPGGRTDSRDTGMHLGDDLQDTTGWQLSSWRSRLPSSQSQESSSSAPMGIPMTDHRRFLLLSDNEPYQALRRLNSVFPCCRFDGIVGGWTPFVTGYPFALFFNDQHYHGGMTGIGWRVPSTTSLQSSAMEHTGLQVLGDMMEVTQCQGNVILELNGKSPAEYLIKSMRLHPTMQGQEIYVVLDVGQRHQQVRRVLGSGAPAVGQLSVEMNGAHDLMPGQRLQFAWKSSSSNGSVMSPSAGGLVLGNLGEVAASEGQDEASAETTSLMGASSETGFIFSRRISANEFVSDVQTTQGSYLKDPL
jgi:hypothetical protein